jgi:hypothetical protein
MNSAIYKGLVAATGFKPATGATFQALAAALVLAVQDLPDDKWDGLSPEQQDWFNDAATAVNTKKEIAPFPDLVAEAAAPTRRRAAAPAPVVKEPEPEAEPQVDDVVTVTNARDKVTEGIVLEITDAVIVLLVGEEEVEFSRDRLKSIVISGQAEAEQDSPALVLEVGATVKVTNARDKVTTGVVVELDDAVIVIRNVGNEEVEFTRDRLKSVEVVLGAAPAAEVKKEAPAAAPAGRASRAAAAPAAAAPAAAAKPEATARITAAANGGVSATTRMRELIVENQKLDKASVSALLTKEGLAFKPSTFDLVFGDVHKLLGMLAARNMLK